MEDGSAVADMALSHDVWTAGKCFLFLVYHAAN